MLSIDAQKTAEELIEFIKSAFKKAGFSKAVIGLSGGVDSATAAALAVRALGANNVFVFLLPYGTLNSRGAEDAKKIVRVAGIPSKNVTVVNIQPAVDAILATETAVDDVRRGNAMARVRMTILFDQAKKLRGLVVGTENKSEHLLGYFTRFGDSASDIEPLRNLYKTQVYQLAAYLGIPREILEKPPTAGLWEGQTDEGEFGFTYKEADEILFQVYDQKKSAEEVIQSGFEKATVEKVLSRVAANSFKHGLPMAPAFWRQDVDRRTSKRV